ncbi:hypothetical protein HKX48_000245 [Thoreauomyces humboldtii]|nr:hypothetical protein HKX48_000245 [Thoreauomyces humboldtii]
MLPPPPRVRPNETETETIETISYMRGQLLKMEDQDRLIRSRGRDMASPAFHERLWNLELELHRMRVIKTKMEEGVGV